MPTENKILMYLRHFLEYLEIEKGRSQLTVRNYDFYLRRFIHWSKLTKPEDITLEIVRNFRLFLNRLVWQNKTLKKSTQNYHLIALRSFLKYLAKHDVKTLASEKIELAKVGERVVDFLEGSDLDRILGAPFKTQQPEIIQLRDKAILETLFSTGLRVSELANLNQNSINLAKDEFTVRGKGDKPRMVFLSDQAKYAVKQYLAKRKDLNPALFVGHDRAQKSREKKQEQQLVSNLTPRSIQRLIEKYTRVAGLTKHVTPHTLRHSYATDLLRNGADIRSVQTMLGHASITTTQIYTHVTNEQLKETYKKFHGKSN
ncbi:MAG: tyrosine-type recombinase/integrase [Candidatus Komeilibacteria bacterium]|nr:tyrosine-type recombinase/integrase [Candidatus Komeilibacteria bacterium]